MSFWVMKTVGDENKELPETFWRSFIIKIGLQAVPGNAKRMTWRGQITLVPGSESRTLLSLFDITDYVASYLESQGIRLRTYRWLRRLCKPFQPRRE